MSMWGWAQSHGREPGRPRAAGSEERRAGRGGGGAEDGWGGGGGAGARLGAAAAGGRGSGGAGSGSAGSGSAANAAPVAGAGTFAGAHSAHPAHRVFPARPVHPAGESRPHRVGRRGEQVAAGYLRQRGYRLLDRNWRSPDGEVPGELDLVLRHRGTLVICEVKARTSGHLAHPAEAVTPEKAARLRRLAVVWLKEHDRHHSIWRPAVGGLPALVRAATSFVAPSSASPAPPPPAAIRIDVVAVRLAPREPFPVLGIDHLIGVA